MSTTNLIALTALLLTGQTAFLLVASQASVSTDCKGIEDHEQRGVCVAELLEDLEDLEDNAWARSHGFYDYEDYITDGYGYDNNE